MKSIVLCCLSALLLLTACSDSNLTRIDDLSPYRGKWVVINYWADWCKPCIEEIPELNKLARNQQAAVSVFAVNYDGISGSELTNQADKIGIHFTLLATDPAAKLNYPVPNVLPTTVVFDPNGKLYRTLVGPQTESTLTQLMMLR